MRSTLSSLSALLLTLSACGVGPEPRLSHAVAMPQCGPADEGFTGIALGAEPINAAQLPYPHVALTLPAGVNTLAGKSWDIDANTYLPAWYVTNPNKSEPAVSGHVSITSVDAASTVVGSVSLRFPSRFVEMPFTAPWLNTGMLCN